MERIRSAEEGDGPNHVLTVDLEEYFHDQSLQDLVQPAEWRSLPSRLDRSVDRLLPLLERHDATATFFVVGWLAEEHPELVRRIWRAGHEVASHGHLHHLPGTLDARSFRAELRASRKAIRDATGVTVVGYRAPGAPLEEVPEWFFDVLTEEGFRYDSSLATPFWPRPIATTGRAPAGIVERPGGNLLEIPTPTLRVMGAEVLTLGGSTLRQLPTATTEKRLRTFRDRGDCVAVQLRSWEMDPGVPRLPRDWLSRLRKYRNQNELPGRLESFLAAKRFESVNERFGLGVGSDPAPEGIAEGSEGDVRQTG